MKNTKKLISLLLAAMLLITTVAAASVSVSATGTLASYYKTNPNNQFGKQKTITVDGAISDWDSTMLVAQGTANDDPRVYRPNSMYENPIDLYALFAAYDDSNLYLMWEMTNVQDIVSPDDNYPLAQGHLYQTENVPFFIAIDTGKSDVVGNNGKTSTGGTIWGSGISFQSSFNKLIAVSTNGANGPYIYGGDSSGLNAVELYNPTTSGITYKYGEGIVGNNVYGINKGHGIYNDRVPGDMCNESAAWVDFNTLGHDSPGLDFHYEMSIPLDKLGITKNDITSNGIGALVIATYGKSGMDCLPYDLTMNDNADQEDPESNPNNSFEKSDADTITTSFARIGAQGDAPVPVTVVPSSEPTQATEAPSSTAKVIATSNFFSASNIENLAVGDTVTVKYDLNASKNIASAQWSLNYDSSKLRLLTSGQNLCPNGGGQVNDSGVPVYGNFTDANSLVSFQGGKTFVEAEFEVLATGTASVDLNVEELNIGYYSGNELIIQSAVENSVPKTVQGLNITASSTVTEEEEESSSGTTTPTVVPPTDPPAGDLVVNATSNFFHTNNNSTQTVSSGAGTDEVTVCYRLKTSLPVINAQWSLTYDSTKLELVKYITPKMDSTFVEPRAGVLNGNFTNSTPVSFKTADTFIKAKFKAKGTGTTAVNLNVEILGIAKVNDNNVTIAYLVDNGQVNDITGTSGFSSFSSSTESHARLTGDVNLDGVVNIQDATALQRYLAEFSTLSTTKLVAADTNLDEYVDIRDVTVIRRLLLAS